MEGVENVAEFIDPGLLPTGKVRIGAFDGENADPYNGRPLEPGLRAFTPGARSPTALPDAKAMSARASDEPGVGGAVFNLTAFPGGPYDVLDDDGDGKPATTLTQECVLNEALTQLWERARARRFTHVQSLRIKVFDPTDGFRLLGLVAGVQQAEKHVAIQGGYETTAGGNLDIDFGRGCEDAQPLTRRREAGLGALRRQGAKITK
jgi:hypothetical protein